MNSPIFLLIFVPIRSQGIIIVVQVRLAVLKIQTDSYNFPALTLFSYNLIIIIIIKDEAMPVMPALIQAMNRDSILTQLLFPHL
jgi:hypothetical protein